MDWRAKEEKARLAWIGARERAVGGVGGGRETGGRGGASEALKGEWLRATERRDVVDFLRGIVGKGLIRRCGKSSSCAASVAAAARCAVADLVERLVEVWVMGGGPVEPA